MLLGIDVGGTHTDAVVLDTSGLIDWAKVPTDPQDLLGSIDQAVNRVQNALSSGQLSRFALSTTLCANALIQKRVDPVGVLVFAGPGIDPDQQALGDYFEILPGVIDHRGSVVQDLDSKALSAAVQRFVTAGLKSFACVGKFSPRNPRFELQAAQDLSKHSEHVTLGHRLSGELNFPRRIHTAYYNSAVWKTFNVFADAVAEILKRRGLQCPVDMLKADAGTMNFDVARTVPVETVFSGSAASVMGVSALCSTQKDAILLDIGGTTTDVALFAEGNPIVERQGIPLRGRPTLVKGLKTRSVGIGGDSAVYVLDGELRVGPHRYGPCLACGGQRPTLVDALNVQGAIAYGDVRASEAGIADIADVLACSAPQAAEKIIYTACTGIKRAISRLLEEINQRPVYTVHELLLGKVVHPQEAFLMGGPAKAMARCLGRRLGVDIIVPKHAQVANAIGAAVSRSTLSLELFADTQQGRVCIPALGLEEQIGGDFDLKAAKEMALTALRRHMNRHGLESAAAKVVEASSMNMVRDMVMVGRDLRVRCQVQPGLVQGYEQVLRSRC